jgi:hypothetical protein
MNPLMELRGRLSNPEAAETVASAAEAVARIKVDAARVVLPRPATRRWRLVDRLGEQDIRKLVADRRAGATMRALAERHGISLSSVKRLVRHATVH